MKKSNSSFNKLAETGITVEEGQWQAVYRMKSVTQHEITKCIYWWFVHTLISSITFIVPVTTLSYYSYSIISVVACHHIIVYITLV